VLGGHGHVAVVLEPDDPVLDEIDMGDQSLDGVAPRGIRLAIPQEGERADDAAPGLVGPIEESGRERGAERSLR
jgi:hypothetical protein